MPLRLSLSPESQALLAALHRRAAARTPWRRPTSPEPELSTLVARGDLASVPEVLPLVLSGPAEWLEALRRAVAALVRPWLPDNLPALDLRLREERWNAPPDIEAWWRLSPTAVSRLPGETADDQVLLGLCASHPSGYVREQAITRLARGDPDVVLPFLLVRVNDWVPAVRVRARTAVVGFLQPSAAPALIRCLPLLDRLAGATRADHEDLIAQVETVLRDPGSFSALEQGLRSPDRRVRRRCHPIAAATAPVSSEALLRQAANDPDVLVRRWAYGQALGLPSEEVRRSFLSAAARDHFGPIRRMAFEYWQGEGDQEARRIRDEFLLDVTAGLRSEAQADFRARGMGDPVAWYRGQFDDARGRRLIGALAGLSETGGREDVVAVRRQVNHRSARVRRAALRALSRLDPDAALPPLVGALMREAGAVAREAARCLCQRLGDLDPASLWAEARSENSQAVRCRLLRLFRGLPKWTCLEFTLRAIAASDPRLQALGQAELERWSGEFNRRLTPVPPTQIQDLSALLDAVAERLPARLVREVRFVLRP